MNRRKKLQEKKTSGFSMVELIIVIAIMAILVALIGTQLIPYLERSRSTRDYNAIDALFTAYSSEVAEAEDPKTITLEDENILKKVGFSSMSEFTNALKSKQFHGTTVACYVNTGSKALEYGICIYGMNGYTGVQIDSKGTKCKLGKKGGSDRYVDEATGKTVPMSKAK